MAFRIGKFGLAAAAALISLPGYAAANECGEALLAQGEEAYGRGHIDVVVQSFTEALETCDVSDELAAHIYARRGIANFASGDMEASVADYSASLELAGSRSSLILMKRAAAYIAADAYALAIADLNEAIGIEPEKGALYLLRMRANRELGNDEAVQADLAFIEESMDMSTKWAAYKMMGLDPETLTQ